LTHTFPIYIFTVLCGSHFNWPYQPPKEVLFMKGVIAITVVFFFLFSIFAVQHAVDSDWLMTGIYGIGAGVWIVVGIWNYRTYKQPGP